MSENRIAKIFGQRIFLIALFMLLSIGKLYCQFEKDYLNIGFDINSKISIVLQFPSFIENNRLSDYTIPYKYGIRKDNESSATAYLVIDTISKNDFRILCSMEFLDSVKTKYGQTIKLYKWFNYNKYNCFINGILNIDDKVIMLSYLSNAPNDFKALYELYTSILITLDEGISIEIPEVSEE